MSGKQKANLKAKRSNLHKLNLHTKQISIPIYINPLTTNSQSKRNGFEKNLVTNLHLITKS